MSGSEQSYTPLRYNISYRNYYLVTSGAIKLKLIQPSNGKYLQKEYDYDIKKLLAKKKNEEMKKWIKQTKCKCTYECAMSFNILGNWRYQHKLLSSLISFY